MGAFQTRMVALGTSGLLLAVLAGCGGGSAGMAAEAGTAETSPLVAVAPEAAVLKIKPSLKALPVEVGEKLFKDPTLSASGRMACATCHAEAFGHADKFGTGLPLGGPELIASGMRSSPTIRYLNENPVFKIDGRGIPRGGFTWDGRADSRKEQGGAPFFEHVEMALPGSVDQPSALTDKVRASDYYVDIQKLYKPKELDTDAKLFTRITELLEIYQRDDEDYNLFDSRYDQWLVKKAVLTPSELRGLEIFKDANRGNCIACHGADGKKPLFTDFGSAALAAPRNHQGPKNVDPAYFDLGLCARERSRDETKKQIANDPRYCGMFKTPTLRNIERTAPYFHNASVPTLEAAVRFHFERDTQPAKWFRQADGSVDRRYNDLPLQHHANIARGKPFDGSYSPTDADIADLIGFLKTLNDADQTEPLR